MSIVRTLHGWSYSGTAWTNRDGRAVVVLPQAVRSDRAGFDYELNADDGAAARVDEPIGPAGRFTIATDRPHVRVEWRVTPYRDPSGTRHDRKDKHDDD
jgi:hypothetical protein